MSVKQDNKDPNLLVAYHHRTGESFLVNPQTGATTPTIKNEEGLAERDQLKGPNGQYRPEVKAECKRLYMLGVSIPTIAERMSMGYRAIERWAYDPKKGWLAERKKRFQKMEEENESLYVKCEQKALERILDFLDSHKAKIQNNRDFREFSQAVTRIIRSPDSDAKGGGRTQINIGVQQNMKPLSLEEAKNIIANDPIKIEAEVVNDEE